MSAFITVQNYNALGRCRSDHVELLPESWDGSFSASLQFINGDNHSEVYAEIEVQELIDGLVELGLVEKKQ